MSEDTGELRQQDMTGEVGREIHYVLNRLRETGWLCAFVLYTPSFVAVVRPPIKAKVGCSASRVRLRCVKRFLFLLLFVAWVCFFH